MRRSITVRTIAFLSILIAISVVFVIIGVRLFPPSVLPGLRFSFLGIPIKITGYIFGPTVGLITGIFSDLISFLFVPSTYSPYFTIAAAMAGAIPGISHLIYHIWFERIYNKKENIEYLEYKKKMFLKKNKHDKAKKIDKLIQKVEKKDAVKLEKRKANMFLLSSIVIISLIMLSIALFIIYLPDNIFQEGVKKISGFLGKKNIFIPLLISGLFLMMLFLIVLRFWKPKLLIQFTPIVIFSAILEPITVILLAAGDFQSGIFKIFAAGIVAHTILTPIKIWINLFVIYITFLIVSPLIFKKQNNSYTK